MTMTFFTVDSLLKTNVSCDTLDKGLCQRLSARKKKINAITPTPGTLRLN
jgi:hypothetical protein